MITLGWLEERPRAKGSLRPRVPTLEQLGGFKLVRNCHENVDRWIAVNSGHKPMRGWLIHPNFFWTHSIVDTGLAQWDITACMTGLPMPFLPFGGNDADFPFNVPQFYRRSDENPIPGT